MSAALFDVNFLLALAWPQHQFHPIAQTWFDRYSAKGWATCTATQLGFIRLSSNRSYLQGREKTPAGAILLLEGLTSDARHQFLSQPEQPIHFAEMDKILNHHHVTDAYLIGIARLSGTRLITFDRQLSSLANPASLVEVLTPEV